MQALHIIVFCIISYALALDIFIDSPVLLLDCRYHVSEEPVEYTTKFNSTEKHGESKSCQPNEDPIDPKDFFGAARDGDLCIINAAISQLSTSGFDLNWQNPDYYDYTALHIATRNEHTNIVAALLDAGTDPNVGSKWRLTPLHIAVEWGYIDSLELLLDHGGDPNKMDIDGSPLWVAADKGHTGALKLLLNHGGDPNKESNAGSSPLQRAIRFWHMETATMLIQAGANVNYVDPNDGLTALHHAVVKNAPDMALLLLQNGAQKDKQDNDGDTAADWANDYGYDSLAQLIDNY